MQSVVQLTEEDLEKVKKWLEERAGQGFRCFVCGLGHWSILPNVAITSMFDTYTGRIFYMDGIPQVAVLCNDCGHIVWFSARVMGLLPEPVAQGTGLTEEVGGSERGRAGEEKQVKGSRAPETEVRAE